MVEFIFTHDSTENALKTRDMLHECLKGCDAYVNNDIILSDSNSECKPGDWTFKFKTKNGEEVEFKHCITLVICTENESEYRHVIHVAGSDLFPLLNGLSISIGALTNGNKEKVKIAKWFNF